MIKVCERRGREFEAVNASARFCRDACRKRAARLPGAARKRAARRARLSPPPGWSPTLTEECRRELAEAGRLETAFGEAAMILAVRIDAEGWAEPGGGLAAMTRELNAAMSRALGPPLVVAGENVVPLRRRGGGVGGEGDHG